MLFCYPVRGALPWLAGGVYLLMLVAVLAMPAGEILMMVRMSPPSWEAGWFMHLY